MTSPPCPKCKSHSTHISRTRSPYIGHEADLIFHCVTCGTRVYGPDKVKALVAQYEAVVQAAREREEQLLAEERRWKAEQEEKRAAEAAERLALKKAAMEASRKEARRKAVEEEILRNAKCAWPPCENDHTMTSRYCSRTCSNKNAHAREKAKKEAAKAATAG
jgi:hypothetical protein